MSNIREAPSRTTLVLAILFAGTLVMGCAEVLVVGILDLIAADLSVSVSATGGLVTANALGIAIGGPLLTLLTTRFDRRAVLLASIAVFVAANLLPALGVDYPVFLLARVSSGAVQGLFIAAAIVTATSIVPPERTGRAMALVLSGFAISSAVGVPLGTLLGQAVGWRVSFAAVAAVAVGVLLCALADLPSVPPSSESRGLGQVRHAFAPRVLGVLALACLIFVAIGSAFTYLVPFLNQITGVSGPAVSAYLLAYGIATAVGTYGGGRFADSDASRSLIVGTIGVMASLFAMHLVGGHALFVALTIFGLGLFGMGVAPSIQHRVESLAGPGGGSLAASLPASAANAGDALGSLAGGASIEFGGASTAIVTAATVAVIAVAAAWATRFLKPATELPSPPVTATR